MGFTVADLLKSENVTNIKLVCGESGLSNEIKGVTIIEAPDIVKFINGGELLLTGLYAFRSVSMEEFKYYLSELKVKGISGIVVKTGRKIDDAVEKFEYIKEFGVENAIPVMEVPFEMSFQEILCTVMENIFNEEVTQLKYYKTTHDNFSALAFSKGSNDNQIERIMEMLFKMIHNPVALYDKNEVCYASAGDISEFALQKDARSYNPGLYSTNQYFKQVGDLTQYVIKIQLNVGVRMYLVVTEKLKDFTLMDCIAIENAIIALQYEFSRSFAVSELEKKFQNDILHDILTGNVKSIDELKKNTKLLGINVNGLYRVLVMGIQNDGKHKSGINEKVLYLDLLEEEVKAYNKEFRVYRDLEELVIVAPEEEGMTQAEYRKKLKDIYTQLQALLEKKSKYLKLKMGAGKIVEGIIHLPETYKEAKDAFFFVDIAGEAMTEPGFQMLLFSDLGIFKLLSNLETPEQMMEYVPESLQRLYNYKKPQRDDLVMTLKTYLDRNQNLSKTAQDLFVHYKTAVYRIEKITKITGIDFENANEVLSVRIGLVIYKMIEYYNQKHA